VETVRRAGFSDGEIAEIIAHVALNIFTNYFNNTAEVEVDFPKAPRIETVQGVGSALWQRYGGQEQE